MRLILTFLCRLLISIFFRVDLSGLPEKFPDGPFLICANHASQWDPLVVLAVCSKRDKRPIRFVAKKELAGFFIIRWALNKMGAIFIDRQDNDITALKTILSALKNGDIIGIFPEGTRVHEINPANMKGGVGFLAQRSGAAILTAKIESNYKLFSKMKISFRPIFYPDNLKGSSKKEGRRLVSQAIFNKIYDTSYPLEMFED